MLLKRRFFLFAAPAIVAAPSLMRVSTAAFAGELRYVARLTEGDWYEEFYKNLRANPPEPTLNQRLALEVQRRTEAAAGDLFDPYKVHEWGFKILRADAQPLIGGVRTWYDADDSWCDADDSWCDT